MLLLAPSALASPVVIKRFVEIDGTIFGLSWTICHPDRTGKRAREKKDPYFEKRLIKASALSRHWHGGGEEQGLLTYRVERNVEEIKIVYTESNCLTSLSHMLVHNQSVWNTCIFEYALAYIM